MNTFQLARERMSKRLDLLNTVEIAIKADPLFARELSEMLAAVAGESPSTTPVDPPPASSRGGRPRIGPDSQNVAKIKDALTGKDWVATAVIRVATGLNKNQFFTAVRANAELFESRKDPANSSAMQWRLKTPGS